MTYTGFDRADIQWYVFPPGCESSCDTIRFDGISGAGACTVSFDLLNVNISMIRQAGRRGADHHGLVKV